MPIIEFDEQKVNLAEIMSVFTDALHVSFQNNKFNKEVIDKFVSKYLIDCPVPQPCFMSTAMVKSSAQNFAKKIFWTIKVPRGIKGTSIESFNIERKREAEFLGQRDGRFVIKNAIYKPENNFWYFGAYIEQGPLTTL